MYREIAGTNERVRAIPGVRDRRVRATKVRLYLSSYSPLNEGHVCILTNSMLRTSTSDRDERIILRRTGEIS